MAKKIILADDDKDLVYALQIRLEKDGYNVLVSYNGEACLELAQKELPDLIIMDVTMPKMDGYSAVKVIKFDEEIKHIPIIVSTGKDHMEDIFKMEGVKEYVVKPFEFKDFSLMVKKILGETAE